MRRRAALAATPAALGTSGLGLAGWLGRPPRLPFEPLRDPPGCRRLAGRALATSPAAAALAGLDPRADPGADGVADGGAGPGGADLRWLHLADGTGLPAAFVTDFASPVCGPLDERLAARKSSGEIALTRHPVARLGAASAPAALAAAAAELQGGSLDRRLYRSRFLPTEGWLRAVAAEEGLDPDRLIADMGGAAAQGRVARSEALARRFGVAAVPVVVIGRTVVTGAPARRALDALIEHEREAMWATTS